MSFQIINLLDSVSKGTQENTSKYFKGPLYFLQVFPIDLIAKQALQIGLCPDTLITHQK